MHLCPHGGSGDAPGVPITHPDDSTSRGLRSTLARKLSLLRGALGRPLAI
jgi:hypothetical protein